MRELVRPRWETPDPPGVTGTYGDRVIRWGQRNLGIRLGPWQRYTIRKVLRHDKRGDLVHKLVLYGTARQCGKSVIVRLFFGWLLDEGRKLDAFAGWTTILAAAHDAKQARIIYRGVFDDLMAIPRLTEGTRRENHETGHTPPLIKATLQQGIWAKGLMLDTVTSEPGSSRGLSAGAIAWDEMLTQRDWRQFEALSPTQTAQRSPIMLLTSTAGYEDSVVLRAFYDRLRRQATGDEAPDPTFYGAWWESEDEDAQLDWRQIRMANPALGDGRLTRQAIAAEHAILPPDSWRRERLNHFVDVRAAGAFHPGLWAACRTGGALDGLGGPYALGVDVQPGWQRATVAVAGVREDGRVGVAVYRDIRGTPDEPVTAARIVREIEAFPNIRYVTAISFDSISGIAPELRRRKEETWEPYEELTRQQFVASCMDVAELIQSRRLAVDDPLLDAQVPLVARREIGSDGMFYFSRGQSLGPVDAFLAMTFAAHSILRGDNQPRIT